MLIPKHCQKLLASFPFNQQHLCKNDGIGHPKTTRLTHMYYGLTPANIKLGSTNKTKYSPLVVWRYMSN